MSVLFEFVTNDRVLEDFSKHIMPHMILDNYQSESIVLVKKQIV